MEYITSEGDHNLIAIFIKNWLDNHPMIGWGIAHPFWMLGIILVVLFFLWELLKATLQFIEQGSLFLLRSPFKLVKLLLQANFRFSKTNKIPIMPPSIERCDMQERLHYIAKRLEEIRQEQDELLMEASSILTSNSGTQLTTFRDVESHNSR
jgi:hypothetical protein